MYLQPSLPMLFRDKSNLNRFMLAMPFEKFGIRLEVISLRLRVSS